MTISGLLFAIYGWYNVWISHNLFYSLDLVIIIGFAISIVTKYFCNKTNKSNRSDNGQNHKKYYYFLFCEKNLKFETFF